MSPEQEPLTTVFAERCECGYTKDHKRIRANCTWSNLGYLALAVLGVNARPRQVEYECILCHTVLERTRDPAVLEAHRSQPK